MEKEEPKKLKEQEEPAKKEQEEPSKKEQEAPKKLKEQEEPAKKEQKEPKQSRRRTGIAPKKMPTEPSVFPRMLGKQSTGDTARNSSSR